MATRNNFLTKLFLFYNAMSLFIIHSSADEKLIKNICKQTSDYQYCTDLYFGDSRSLKVGVQGLALIAIQTTIIKVEDTINNRFPELSKKITDPVGKQRLGVCKTDYTNSLNNFSSAFQSTSKSDYWKAIDWIRKGANNVIDCQDIYKRKNPIADSPMIGFKQRNSARVVRNYIDLH